MKSTQTNNAGEGLLRAEQAAEFLGISLRTINAWRMRRVGPPWIKMSARAVRYAPSALRAWLDAHAVQPSSPDV